MTNATRRLDAYDYANGSMLLEWSEFPSAVPDSYNVYVNGVLNQNVGGRKATVVGLISATPYTFQVTGVLAGVETGSTLALTLVAQPTSEMTTTPMKRAFPFGGPALP